VDTAGRVLVGYADGCTGTCAAPGGVQNFDAYATIARQQSGRTLYAANDPLANLTPTGLSVAKKAGLFVPTATLANTGAAKALGSTLQLIVDGKVVAASSEADLGAGQSRIITFAGLNLAKGVDTITVVADPGNTVRESNEADNNRSSAVTA